MRKDIADEPPNVEVVITEALARASEAEAAGDDVGALHILRSVRYKALPSVTQRPDGQRGLFIPAAILVLRAREAWLSLRMGQWGDSPRHGPNSDSPHGFVTMYESLGPQLPEANRQLRFWMDRLRTVIADDHKHWPEMAAWALDLYNLSRDIDDRGVALEAVANMAVAMSHLGYIGTAKGLYQRLLADANVEATDRASILIRYGDFLWQQGDTTEAEDHYSEALATYQRVTPPRLNDFHEQVRALQRRADCRVLRGARELALQDLDAAFRTIDRSRSLGGYQSHRSVDAPIASDIAHLLHMLHRIGPGANDADEVIGALCRVANSSAAASARAPRPRDPDLPVGSTPWDRTSIYIHSNPQDRPDIYNRVLSSVGWTPITETDIQVVMDAQDTVMMIAATERGREVTSGITVFCGAGITPRVHRWTLQSSARRMLNELLSPSPGAAVGASGPWVGPWNAPELVALADIMMPTGDLAARLQRARQPGLRIVPVGSLWRFPFAAVPLDGTPLGRAAPYVLTPGPTHNVPAPGQPLWAGHFDLSLPNAMYELLDVLDAIRQAGVAFRLFGGDTELGEPAGGYVSHLLFAGHGTLGRGQQRLLMANGRRCGAPDLAFLAPGASVILNACWSGTVFDEVGSDPADLALSFLASGAHSVLGTVGPVSDQHAVTFLSGCVSALIEGRSVAASVHRTIDQLLADTPSLPLSSWACYTTVGRAIEFAPSAAG